jgi:hypothetical protein
MSKSGSRKRAAPEISAEYTHAKWVEDASWKFNKSNWNKKGETEYKKLKGKVDRGEVLEGYEKYLMTVHFPKIAPNGHPIAEKEANAANASSKKRIAASAPVFGGEAALSQVYHHYLEISFEVTSYMESV